MAKPLVSVLMPTYNQHAFITRALESLTAQTFTDWELVIMDDGSTVETRIAVESFLEDVRVRYYRRAANGGLGLALNDALAEARGELIAYLPSDDIYYADHLASLVAILRNNPDAVMAVSGVRHHYNRSADGQISGYPVQLVQVMHRKTIDRWLERTELVTDDLHRMYWGALEQRGKIVYSRRVTCEWVHHRDQLHRLLREPEGGINAYRSHFNVKHPLRFHSTIGNFIDEYEHYRPFRERPDTPAAPDGLKILLVGELAYNAERVLALEERGHKLYGLWMKQPHWYNTVGPLPFGHVEDVPYDNWVESVKAIQPDVIYALLNWQAVPFAHDVLMRNPGIPFVWHFKESPFICFDRGTWPQLVDLYTKSDGQIYCSPEMRDWFAVFLGSALDPTRTLIMDGDLPKREWFTDDCLPLLSEQDGEIHTVVPGRPIGLHPSVVEALARERIHVHFYGDYTQGQWKEWIDKVKVLAPGYLHLHPNVGQQYWTREFSQYDAGWLHVFPSDNGGELRRAIWDDLNYPARIATLAAAGLPMLQGDNTGHIAATQALAETMGIGICFRTIEALGSKLRDRENLQRIRQNVWQQRQQFTFDAHADRLIAFFRSLL
ncbi:MAG: glycosyltransferase [Chloroflexi bacterium]|nr:glycosyltransferase [Chloroflexota bacterium]